MRVIDRHPTTVNTPSPIFSLFSKFTPIPQSFSYFQNLGITPHGRFMSSA
jgi:hypothetical protein